MATSKRRIFNLLPLSVDPGKRARGASWARDVPHTIEDRDGVGNRRIRPDEPWYDGARTAHGGPVMIKTRLALTVVGLAVVVALSAGCSSSSGSAILADGRGQVRIVLSSTLGATEALADSGRRRGDLDPLDGLQAVEVTVSRIQARDLDENLVDVEIEMPVTVDILSLTDLASFELPIGFIEPGTYDALVVVITAVDLVTTDGTRLPITPPDVGWTGVIEVCPFEVVAGQTTTVRVVLQRDRSFRVVRDSVRFDPEFECTEP